MKILLIDNGTIHISELKKVIQNHQTTIVHKEDLERAKYFDLIILSGSSVTPIVKNPNIYKKEIKLIYGFQFHPEILDENNYGSIIFNNLLKQIVSKTNEFSTTKH